MYMTHCFDEFCSFNIGDQDMVGNMLWFTQNTYNSHYMRVNFIDLKTQLWYKRQRYQCGPVAFTTVLALLIMTLWELTPYSLRNLFAFEDLRRIQQIIFKNGRYDTMNYAIIPWKRFDDFIVGDQNKDIFPYKSSHGLVLDYFDIACNTTNPYTFYVLVQCVRLPWRGGSDSFIVWIVRVYTLGLCSAQIISHHKQKVMDLGKENIMI